MPRSMSATIWSCTLSWAAGVMTIPDVRAQQDRDHRPIILHIEGEKDGWPILSVVRPGAVRPVEGAKPQGAPGRRFSILSLSNLDAQIFGFDPRSHDRPPLLQSILETRIWNADRWQPLSDAQRAKLALAGKGDIKHLADRTEEIRTPCLGLRQVLISPDDAPQLLQELYSLRAVHTDGPFGPGSLFDKALRQIRREQAAGRGDR